ncbi:putative protease IV [Pseudomonas aeruginosa]|nr:putative protease IV [Pseudomonas aeruginosa]AWE77142.1 putative protease IV [Pseudomonas aeruginosa]RCH32623.1 putative protease IV [Pseudomonas aeruginosa]
MAGARRRSLEHGDVASHFARTGRGRGLARARSQRENQACIQVRSLMHESTPSVWGGQLP